MKEQTPLVNLIRNNAFQIMIMFVSFIIAWTILNAEVGRIRAQQDTNTAGILLNKDVEQSILVTLARIETSQDNILKDLVEIKADLKLHINQ